MILSKPEKQLLKDSAVYLKPHKWKLGILYSVTILSNIAELFPIYFTGNILNYVVDKNFKEVIACIFKILIVFVITMILSTIETYLAEYIKNKITVGIKNNIFNKVITLPMKEHHSLGMGHLMSVLEGDSASISDFYTEKVINIIIAAITVIASFIFMIRLSIILTVLSIATFPLSFIGTKYFGKKIKSCIQKLRKLNDEYTLDLTETLSNVSEVKCLCIEKNKQNKFYQFQEKFFQLNMKNSVLSMYSNIFDLSMSSLTDWIIIGVGCFQMIHNKLKIGGYVAFNGFSEKFTGGINSLLEMINYFQTLSVSLKRISDLLEKESEDIVLSPRQMAPYLSEGKIVISDVSFQYEYSHELILDQVNMMVKTNAINVIVGLNGSGKSTLLKLLERLYAFNKGKIEIDGTNIMELTCGELRQNISYVQQDTYLFSGTIKYNLAFENPDITEKELYEVCQRVGIHEFIMSLPKQYETLLGKGGINLSGGETQKLAIARALLRKTKIILLDESTSDLDGAAEYEILNVLHEISNNHTIIMISHRISAIVGMENINLFQDGRIVAYGSHDELIKQNEEYQKLMQSQAIQ